MDDFGDDIVESVGGCVERIPGDVDLSAFGLEALEKVGGALVGWSVEAREQIEDSIGAEASREKIPDLSDALDRTVVVDALVRVASRGAKQAPLFVVAQES